MPSRSKEAVELYNLGLNLAKQSRYEEAIQPLIKSLNADGSYVNAHNLLGKIYKQLGEIEMARASWKAALQIDPLNSTAEACLKVSPPASFAELFRNAVPIVVLIMLIGGLAIIYLTIHRFSNQVDSRLNSLEATVAALSDNNGEQLNDVALSQERDMSQEMTNQPVLAEEVEAEQKLAEGGIQPDENPQSKTTQSKPLTSENSDRVRKDVKATTNVSQPTNSNGHLSAQEETSIIFYAPTADLSQRSKPETPAATSQTGSIPVLSEAQ